jgi:hypothetical protein
MKNEMMMKLIVTAAVCSLSVGCSISKMALRRIDRDIPSALVTKYSTSDAPYVDEGQISCLPLLLDSEGNVAKTHAGFQANRDASFGFGLLISSSEEADYDQKGQLQEFSSHSTLLTGLLLSERSDLVRKGDKLNEGYAWSTLWGLLGFARDVNGAKRLSILWIPIPVAKITND